MKLPRQYTDALAELHQAGGSGALDVHGAVWAGAPRAPVLGHAPFWLTLVSQGLIAGERGNLILTESGRTAAEAVIAGRVRSSV